MKLSVPHPVVGHGARMLASSLRAAARTGAFSAVALIATAAIAPQSMVTVIVMVMVTFVVTVGSLLVACRLEETLGKRAGL